MDTSSPAQTSSPSQATPVPQPETPIPQPVAVVATAEPATGNVEPVTAGLAILPVVHRPKGKIAALPKAQRDTINRLLLDGATYARVAQHMAGEGVSLNGENISNWYQTGFQEYLAELERFEYQRARYESATTLLQDTDTAKLPEAGLQTAAAQIYDLLGRFTPATLARSMIADPDKYTRLLNALFRLSRETLALQKNREAHTQAQAAASQTKDLKRKLSDSERRAIVLEVDDILGVNGAASDPTTPAAPGTLESLPTPDAPISTAI